MTRQTRVLAQIRRHQPITRAALWIYLATTTVVPFTHLWGHRADHVHGANGEVQAFSHAEAHARGLSHEHGQAIARRPSLAVERSGSTGGLVPVSRPLDVFATYDTLPDTRHGHGAAAHFGLAILVGGLFLLRPPARPLRDLVPAGLKSTLADRPIAFRIEARGPPIRTPSFTVVQA